MPLRETEAIVLRTYRLGEADKIVSLFTRQFGRLRGVARGAQRPKSHYGGTLELLTHVRLWLFERENRDLVYLNAVELLESFFVMQKDYRVQVAAQYVAEVSERLLPEREVDERAFRLLVAVLRGLKASREVDLPLLYFNYWLLRLEGFLPDLERCASCGHGLALGSGESAHYATGSEGLVCSNCRSHRGGSYRSLSAGALGLAGRLRQSSLERLLAEEGTPAVAADARHFFEELIETHAEKKLVTRAMLDEHF